MKPGKIYTILLILILNLWRIGLIAQDLPAKFKSSQFRATLWTMVEGLSHDISNVMLKDARGFLWLGSGLGGLCRFDGAIFKKFIPDSQKPGSIRSINIQGLVEDSLGNIWMGTSLGMSRYDLRADTFTNFPVSVDLPDENRVCIPFWSTTNEVYCLESGFRITAYNVHSLKRDVLQTLSDSERKRFGGISINHTVYFRPTNSIWMLSGDSAYAGRGGLLEISLGNGERHFHRWPCVRNDRNHNHTAEAMQFDKNRNSIWINSGDGLLEFSLQNEQFYKSDALQDFIKSNDYDRYVGIDIDREGYIWFATKPRGIIIYDPKLKLTRALFQDPELQKKTGEANFQIYCDRDGISWTSFWLERGIYEILPYDPPVKRYIQNLKNPDSLSSGSIDNIVPGATDMMWIGTADGLNIFNPTTGKFKTLREKELPGLHGKVIIPLYVDTSIGKAWLYTGSADQASMELYEMDILTKICQPITFKGESGLIHPTFLVPTFIRGFNHGLLILDEKNGLFEKKAGSHFAELVIPMKNEYSRFVVEDDRFLFIKIYNPQGVRISNLNFENKNGQWIKIPHLLDSLDWTSMFYNEKDQTHWVSLKYELVHYNKEFRKLRSYGQDEGYDGITYSMLADNAGNIWFNNSLKQIGRLDPLTGIFTTLSETDGFQKQYNEWFDVAAKDIYGNLYFEAPGVDNSDGGVDRIEPAKYLSRSTSAVYLRTMTINQKSFISSPGLNDLVKLTLKHNQNTLSIETGIIDFYAQGRGRIRYKLEGESKEQDWQFGPAYNTIRYEGLLPGSYRLVMQSSNAGNEFNSPEKILMITVDPPWWERWSVRSIFVIVSALLLWSLIQYRSRSLKKRNVALEEKVSHRTKELKHSLDELRDTQAQLIQREKMASLGELTAGIAHEIQNPLNFVNNFSDLNKELLLEMKAEINKGNVSDAENIADDVIDNENKISHHGKRAEAIVKGMLQHSRASTGVKESGDINVLADEYLKLGYHGFRARDKSFNANLRIELDPALEKINIVPQEIGRVFLNIFSNAFYAVNEKKKLVGESYQAEVYLSTKMFLNHVEIRIRDNGTGIPKKILEKIYHPFFTTKPPGEGTGLGLSLSYDIITKMHSGELIVDTSEGLFTEFKINLPKT